MEEKLIDPGGDAMVVLVVVSVALDLLDDGVWMLDWIGCWRGEATRQGSRLMEEFASLLVFFSVLKVSHRSPVRH